MVLGKQGIIVLGIMGAVILLAFMKNRGDRI